MQIGDDLVKARRFVDAAQAGLSRIHAGHESSPILLAILHDAQEMRARGIARSAESAITDTQSPERFQRHIFSLTQLLDQYTVGLEEIAPAHARISETVKVDNSSLHARTKDNLAPLIKFAPTRKQRDALKFLVEFSSSVPANSEEANVQDLNGVNLETVMPTVTDQILFEARQSGKSVSVSYAVGDINVSDTIALEIQNFLVELGSRLVSNKHAFSPTSPAGELSESGVINITALQKGRTLALHVECSGHSPAEATLNLRAVSPLIGRSGIFSVEQIKGNTIARLINIDLKSVVRAALEEPAVFLQEAIL